MFQVLFLFRTAELAINRDVFDLPWVKKLKLPPVCILKIFFLAHNYSWWLGSVFKLNVLIKVLKGNGQDFGQKSFFQF